MLKCCGKILCAHCKLSKVITLCSIQGRQFPGSYYLLFSPKPLNENEIYYDCSLFMRMFPFKTNPLGIPLQLINQVPLMFDLINQVPLMFALMNRVPLMFDLAQIIGFSSLFETPKSLVMKYTKTLLFRLFVGRLVCLNGDSFTEI